MVENQRTAFRVRLNKEQTAQKAKFESKTCLRFEYERVDQKIKIEERGVIRGE